MQGEGKLDELSLSEALTAGRRAFVLAALSVRAGLPEATVHSMMSSGNARAVTALAWKAGMTMEFAEQLQMRLAYIEPRDVLRSAVAARYPLSAQPLVCQIRLFSARTAVSPAAPEPPTRQTSFSCQRFSFSF